MFVKIGAPKSADFSDPIGVLTDCHRRIEDFLGILETLTVADNPEPLNPERRKALEQSLNYFRNSAPKHSADEEESLFPRLKESGGMKIVLAKLEKQHKQIHALQASIEQLGMLWSARGILGPLDWSKLKADVEELSSTYSEHIQIEEHDVFPKVAAVLTAAALTSVGKEMSSRRRD